METDVAMRERGVPAGLAAVAESPRARRRHLRNRVVGVVIGVPLLAFVVWALGANPKLFLVTLLNGLTLAALYFLVASGFTLVFGLMRNVNLAHGSLYLLGAYAGWVVGDASGSWLLAVAVGFLSAAALGLYLSVGMTESLVIDSLRCKIEV